MTDDLYLALKSRYNVRDISVEWFFWHSYYSSKEGKRVKGPYKDRKKFMKNLCSRAGVPYFRFHPLRHAGATFMEKIGIPLSSILGLLGHENRKTTEEYIHSVGRSRTDAIKKYQDAQEQFQ